MQHTHTHTHTLTAIIAGEESESQKCLSLSRPDCETVSLVLSALRLSPPSLFSHTTVIFLAPAPPARVESKASVLYHYLYRVSHYCPLQCPHYPNTALRRKHGRIKRRKENGQSGRRHSVKDVGVGLCLARSGVSLSFSSQKSCEFKNKQTTAQRPTSSLPLCSLVSGMQRWHESTHSLPEQRSTQ